MKKIRILTIFVLAFLLTTSVRVLSVFAFSCGEAQETCLISMKGIRILTSNPAEYATDGDPETYTWNPGAQFANNYMYEVDFGEKTEFSRVEISFSTSPTSSKHQSYLVPPVWYIKTSDDRINWETQKKIYSYYEYNQTVDFPRVSARYIRIVPGERWMGIAEIDILNVDNGLAKPQETEDLTDSGLPLTIVTESSTAYGDNPKNAIYPAFVDNMPYESFTEDERKPYYQLNVTGGQKPYTFMMAGSLPTGLSLSSDGKISGTPTEEGEFTFTVRVRDAKGTIARKSLTMEAKPYRGKWFSDARFGAFIQWGVFSQPYVLNKSAEQVAEFESRFAQTWDAEQWASELSRLGIKVLNYTAVAGDTVRIWPSKTVGKTNLYMERNMALEMIEACHKYGIKIIFYLAGDYSWTSNNGCDPVTGSRSIFTMNCAKELLEMGADGLWLDAGVVEGNYNFDDLVMMMRTVNPEATLQVNAATGDRGYIGTPDVDITNFEGKTNIGADQLSVGFLSATKKKRAAEVTSLLGPVWGEFYDASGNLLELKNSSDMIANIQENWDNGVTYMLTFSPGLDGALLSDEVAAEPIEEICKWVRDNIELSEKPTANLDDKTVYSKSVSLELSASEGASIYYTTDGTAPDETSTLYTEPLMLSKNTHIRAAAYEDGKGKSEILDKTYVFDFYDKVSLLDENEYILSDELKTDIDIYSGMIFTVKRNPIVLESIGKRGSAGEHQVQIIDVTRDYVRVFYETVTFTEGENGFSYASISPVVLEAGSQYRILCDEYAGNTYYPIGNNIFETELIRIESGVWTDSSFTNYYTSGVEDYSQFLDLGFRIYERSRSKNVAIGVKTELQYNSGQKASSSSNLEYASRSVDGRYDTYSAANAYAWTLWLDLGKEYSVDEINVHQKADKFTTSYEVYISANNLRWYKIKSGTGDGTDTTINVPCYGTSFRYIRVRSLKPDNTGQLGGQMFVSEVEVFETEDTDVVFVENAVQNKNTVVANVNIPADYTGTVVVAVYAKDDRLLGVSQKTRQAAADDSIIYEKTLSDINERAAYLKVLLLEDISNFKPKDNAVVYNF